MHNIVFIRDHPDLFDTSLKKRGLSPQAQNILKIDELYRHELTRLQTLQARKNEVAQKVGQLARHKEDSKEKIASYKEEAQQIKEQIAEAEEKTRSLKNELDIFLTTLPNILLPDVPEGKDETENKLVKQGGNIPTFSFNPKSHYELGEGLDQMDFDQASQVSGSRFVFLKKDLARLERALAQFMIDLHTTEFGYELISPPLLVNSQSMFGTGQLPKFADDSFHTTDDKWMIPTSEVSVTCYVANKILDSEILPLRMTAHTPCFRSEAGSAGKDTRGMLRQHQFYKVELISITKPEESLKEHARMVGAAEEVLKRLELPYRIMYLCTGDTGFSAQRTYDFEVWMPSQNTYREISSCSLCGDFQARRMNARFKEKDAKTAQYLHTLNGSGLAVGRTLIAILENYQQEDGSIQIPQVLVPYMKGQTLIKK